MQIGQRCSMDPLGQRRRGQWTVSARVSWFWCGQRLFNDPGYDWSTWLAVQWETLINLQVQVVLEALPSPMLAEAA